VNVVNSSIGVIQKRNPSEEGNLNLPSIKSVKNIYSSQVSPYVSYTKKKQQARLLINQIKDHTTSLQDQLRVGKIDEDSDYEDDEDFEREDPAKKQKSPQVSLKKNDLIDSNGSGKYIRKNIPMTEKKKKGLMQKLSKEGVVGSEIREEFEEESHLPYTAKVPLIIDKNNYVKPKATEVNHSLDQKQILRS